MAKKKKHDKKMILKKGILYHLVTYAGISLVLCGIGVPALISFMVFMVLLWGLFVMSYAFYYQKQ